MNIPNILTVVRIVLAPLFFVAYFLPQWTGGLETASVVSMVVLFAAIEVSDVLDGYIARKYNLVSEIGKVIDPFADVLARLTYFYCFAIEGIMPYWILLILLYRELGVTFLRMMLIRRGVAMAASFWGKAKAVTYAGAGIIGLVALSMAALVPESSMFALWHTAALVLFVLCAVSSVGSFAAYVIKAVPELKEDRPQ
jgi:CDP-diacylglycerol--glycerol-3-phosphate 3-phosphatidyltransferase